MEGTAASGDHAVAASRVASLQRYRSQPIASKSAKSAVLKYAG